MAEVDSFEWVHSKKFGQYEVLHLYEGSEKAVMGKGKRAYEKERRE